MFNYRVPVNATNSIESADTNGKGDDDANTAETQALVSGVE